MCRIRELTFSVHFDFIDLWFHCGRTDAGSLYVAGHIGLFNVPEFQTYTKTECSL
ncbi:Hypothetical protein SMAX5B_005213 [Scophthalmus maximus]|uniref:Uncharacterized protein n=1 Tax=Scophthalmus maximus TaxID=52904 RepID=A0A2U9BFJ3_SCOMX|nr:Hypothetical protein SMAX5B_005213 [Scophthalmus maximus]